MSGYCGRHARMVRYGVILLGASVLAGFSGCGGDPGEGASDNPRAAASGTVKFDGQPIPAGNVVFTHLETGTYSNCPISDGTYENESDDGPLIGKNSVSVIGLEGVDGKPLWGGPWSREVQIEGDTFQQDFEVKSEEVQPYKDIGMDEEAPLS